MEICILEGGSVPRTNRKSSIVRWKWSGRSMDREGRYQLPRYFIKNNGPVKNCFEAKSRPISALPFAGQFRGISKKNVRKKITFSLSPYRELVVPWRVRLSFVSREREREREVGCNQPSSIYPSNSFHELLFELFWVPLKNNLFDSRVRVWWIMRLICRKFAVHKEWFINLIRSEINFGSSSILWLLKKKNEETMREFIMNWFRTTAITS